MSICFCASGCALNSMADPGVFGEDCRCWCHDREQARREAKSADPGKANACDVTARQPRQEAGR